MRKFMKTAACLILAIVLSMLGSCNKKATIELVQDEGKSYFCDFNIVDNSVHIVCKITLSNNSSGDVTVKLNALMYDDVKNGLLAQPVIPGVDLESKESVFFIPAKAESTFDVDFVGELGDSTVKVDRALPQVEITIIE